MVAPGEGKTVMLFGVRFRYKVESGDCGGRLAVLEVEIPAKTLVKPHTHAGEDEFSLVVAGTVGARVGDRVLEAGPGTYLVKPRGTPHAMWNAAGAPAKVVEILCPGGLESYFEELAPILAQHGTPPEYYQLAENYGITIQEDWIKDLESTYGSSSDRAALGRAMRPARKLAGGRPVAVPRPPR
jgi:quercetin dioxygenase-like cupin family protein